MPRPLAVRPLRLQVSVFLSPRASSSSCGADPSGQSGSSLNDLFRSLFSGQRQESNIDIGEVLKIVLPVVQSFISSSTESSRERREKKEDDQTLAMMMSCLADCVSSTSGNPIRLLRPMSLWTSSSATTSSCRRSSAARTRTTPSSTSPSSHSTRASAISLRTCSHSSRRAVKTTLIKKNHSTTTCIYSRFYLYHR